MSIRPTEHLLPPALTAADRKALRAFGRGIILGGLIFGIAGFLVGWLM